jgi:hypothetical protein
MTYSTLRRTFPPTPKRNASIEVIIPHSLVVKIKNPDVFFKRLSRNSSLYPKYTTRDPLLINFKLRIELEIISISMYFKSLLTRV